MIRDTYIDVSGKWFIRMLSIVKKNWSNLNSKKKKEHLNKLQESIPWNIRKSLKCMFNWKRMNMCMCVCVCVYLNHFAIYPKHSKSTICWCCLVTKSCPTLCDTIDCSMPGFPVLHCLLEFAQIHTHLVGGAIQSSHPLLPSPLFALNLSQHQGHFQWVGFSHKVAKVLELQFRHQSFHWIFRVDFL